MVNAIDISHEHLKIVQNILRKYLPDDVTVWVFGSRAKNSAKKFSDLDLALESRNKIENGILIDLKEGFEYSDLPYRVDLVEICDVTETFKKIIDSEKIILPLE